MYYGDQNSEGILMRRVYRRKVYGGHGQGASCLGGVK